MEPVLDLQIEHKGWERVPDLSEKLEKAAQLTLQSLPKKLRFPTSVSVLLTGDAAIKRLNTEFRGIQKPTNVLSFPQFEPQGFKGLRRSPDAVPVGDIAMGYQYIVAEAKRDHKILIHHVTHLLIHGLLHLFGYDHLSDHEAAGMEGLEQKIMAKLNLPDPYMPLTTTRKK